MSMPKRDVIATILVAAAGVLYGLWATGSTVHGVRAVGLAILLLGFAASAIAVVPGFEQLMHGSRIYLAVTVAIGLLALAGGLWMLIAGSEVALAVLVGAIGVLWLIATIHHALLARPEGTSFALHRTANQGRHRLT